MAIVTVYLLNTTGTSPDWFGRVQDNGSAPAGALSAFGWTVAKVALTTAYWRGRIGATARSTTAQAGSYVDGSAGPQKGTGSGATTAGDSFRSDAPLNGTYAAGNWVFTFGMRTGAASNSGRVRFNMWAATNIDGTGGVRKLNSSTLVGTAVTMSTTTTTYNSTVTWAAPQVVLSNEYVFLQPEWQSTVVGTSNSCTAQFYQCSFTTPDYVYAPATGTLAATDVTDDFSSDGGLVGLIGDQDSTEVADDASFDGSVLAVVTGTLGATDPPDDATFDVRADLVGVLAGTDITDITIFVGDVTTTISNDAVLAAVDGGAYELLLHMDGLDASTIFPDSGGMAHTVTAHGAAQVDTSESVFAGENLLLTGSDDYLSLDTGDYAFGTGDLCVDMRVMVSSPTELVNLYDGGDNGFKLFYDSALIFESAAGTITGSIFVADTEYHVAVTRASGLTRLWLGGVQQGATLSDTTDYGTSPGYPHVGGAMPTGTLAAGETTFDVPLFAVSVTWLGTLAATEAVDVVGFSGLVGRSGTMTAPEVITDTALFTGTAVTLGTFATTEAFDVIAISGLVGRIGTILTTEATDVVALTGSVTWLGTLGATEASDTPAFTGFTAVLGTFGVTEGADLASFTTPVPLTGTLGVTEATDIVAINGMVGRIGTLAVIEASDTVAVTGAVRWLGTLDATEAADVVAINGLVGRTGTLTVIEASDVVAITGAVRWLGTLGATEASDVVAINGLLSISGTLGAIETVGDTASFTGIPFIDLGQLGAGGSTTVNHSSLTVVTTAAVAANELIMVTVAVSIPALAPRGTKYGTDTVTVGGFNLTHGVAFSAGAYDATGGNSTTCSLFYGVTPSAIPAGSNIVATFMPGSAFVPDSSSLTARHFAVSISNVVLVGTNVAGSPGTISEITPALDCVTASSTALRVRGASISYLINPDAPAPTATWTGWSYGASRLTYAPPGSTYHQYAYAEHILFTGTNKVSQPTWQSAIHADVYGVFEVVPIQGPLAVTEATDTASFTGTAVTLGSFATTEATIDVAAMNGLVGLTGTLAGTEGADTCVMGGQPPTANSTLHTANSTLYTADSG